MIYNENTMLDAFLCQGVRTPIGRYGGALAMVRTDDLAAHPLATLKGRFSLVDWERIDEVLLGCVTQAGEDNRNVARMALLLAGYPAGVPGVTINRLCASGMEAVASAARSIAVGEISLAVAGGVESMSRAPMVIPKATTAFSRNAEIYDTTLGWRFVNPLMEKMYGTDSMAETGANVAEAHGVSRESQDRFALASAEVRRRAGRRSFRRGDRAGERARPQGFLQSRDRGRASSRGYDVRGSGKASRAFPQGRNRDRR